MNKALTQLEELKKLSSPMRLAAEEWKEPWQTLISTVLSARTRDEKTIPIAHQLFIRCPKLEDLANAQLKEIRKMIRPINFYKTKSKHIKACAKILVERYNSKVPVDFDKLIQLPGVGRKTANVFLSEMGRDTIGIDTHVAYTAQKLGWTKNKDSEKIEDDLKKLFPRKCWKKINPILVRFGKSYTSRKNKDEILERIKNLI